MVVDLTADFEKQSRTLKVKASNSVKEVERLSKLRTAPLKATKRHMKEKGTWRARVEAAEKALEKLKNQRAAPAPAPAPDIKIK